MKRYGERGQPWRMPACCVWVWEQRQPLLLSLLATSSNSTSSSSEEAPLVSQLPSGSSRYVWLIKYLPSKKGEKLISSSSTKVKKKINLNNNKKSARRVGLDPALRRRPRKRSRDRSAHHLRCRRRPSLARRPAGQRVGDRRRWRARLLWRRRQRRPLLLFDRKERAASADAAADEQQEMQGKGPFSQRARFVFG